MFIDHMARSENVVIFYSSENECNRIIAFFRFNQFRHLSFIDMALLYFSQSYEVLTFDKHLDRAIRLLKKPKHKN